MMSMAKGKSLVEKLVDGLVKAGLSKRKAQDMAPVIARLARRAVKAEILAKPSMGPLTRLFHTPLAKKRVRTPEEMEAQMDYLKPYTPNTWK